jgi:hypothetical protein
MTQLKIVKDRVRGVVHGRYTGLYLYGREGTGKTFTVRELLEKLAVRYSYSSGHLTPIGLFDLICENRDRVIVLDDVSSIFNQPIALQLLLAALGNPHDDSGIRWVRYKTAKGDVRVPFTGGVIAVSNLALDGHHLALDGHHHEILRALRDRVFTINYEPSDEQIVALIRHIASSGINGVSPRNCLNVCNFLLAECQSRGVRPSVRLFVDKAMRDFELPDAGLTETHWKDLICSNLEQQLIELRHPTNDLSRAEQIAAERRIALDVLLSFETKAERIEQWKARTGKSQAAFYRRFKELRDDGLVSKDIT